MVALKIFRAIHSPFRLEATACHVDASVGITLCPNDGTTADTLLKNADEAMYLVEPEQPVMGVPWECDLYRSAVRRARVSVLLLGPENPPVLKAPPACAGTVFRKGSSLSRQQIPSFSQSHRWPVALAFVFLLFTVTLAWGQQPGSPSGRNFDRRVRQRVETARAPESATQQEALTGIRRELRGSLSHRLNPETGVTSALSNPTGYLTSAQSGDPSTIALEYVRSHHGLLGLEPGDLSDLEVTDAVYSAVTGTTHIYLRQTYRGLPVYNAQLQVHVNREGRISSVNNAFVPGLVALEKSPAPGISAEDAIAAAADHLSVPLGAVGQARPPLGVRQSTSLRAAALSSETIEAELMWLPVGRDLELVWRFQLHTPDDQHIYDMTVAASASGAIDADRVFTRFDWVSSAQYRVYERPAESPQHAPGRSLAADPQNLTASPLGWHDTGSASFTIMRGNNVHAYQDADANNLPPGSQPTCGISLNCDFPINLSGAPSTYQPAAITNLFYWNNIIHDTQYLYGFDEAGGNFQVNNFGNGGAGGDDVRAEAQDGSGNCNANFATPTDGGRPRMQMFTCSNASPARDGNLDNGVVVHEYGHGISVRQVGGPGNSSCLNNLQQGGEGWSDWFALVYTAESGDQGTDARGIGTYLFGQGPTGPGIRPQPYSTNPAVNNYTYESINGLAAPHGVGSVWAEALWEVYWALVNAHGFDANLENLSAGAGNHRALLYVNEGLKNTACSPTFVDARDGIIQAAIDNFAGEDVCLLWETFAGYGLGVDAVSGGSNSTNPSNGFNLPATCLAPPPAPSCPAGGIIDFSTFTLEPYAGQDRTGTVSVADGGATLVMEGNRWRRSTQSFQVTPSTVLEFQFQSTAEGEIHGIGFDEDQTLSNALRIFQFWGTQNWTGAQQHAPRYSGSGDFESFSIPVGELYEGSAMRLAFVNDKDAGAPTNLGRFACVRILDDVVNTPPVVTVTAPSDGSQFTVGSSITFAGTATDPLDGDLTGGLSWSSSLDGVIGAGGLFSTSSLSEGAHAITASVTDSGGLTGSDFISVTVIPGGCTDCIDWNVTPTVAYSNQDNAGTIQVQDGGSTFFMQGNRWRRTSEPFAVTPSTVIELDFRSTSQGEIHGIGLDEDDTLSNNTRIFQFWGTQNWGGAFQHAPRYSGSGAFETIRIDVGQFYTGSSMFLTLVNDKDAGTQDNTGYFRSVRVFEELPPTCGTVLHSTGFETGTNDWSHSVPDSTCSTGSWVLGDPNSVVDGGVTTQLENDHTEPGVNALFTQPNSSAGNADVDGGVCTALSPTIDPGGASSVTVTLWYYHGQRDTGDDPSGDFFTIDLSTDGGVTYATGLVSIGDVTSNAAWTEVTTTVTNPGPLKLRVRASDGAGPGDLVEAGIDDVLVCIPQ